MDIPPYFTWLIPIIVPNNTIVKCFYQKPLSKKPMLEEFLVVLDFLGEEGDTQKRPINGHGNRQLYAIPSKPVWNYGKRLLRSFA
jgi:hypothetical protein